MHPCPGLFSQLVRTRYAALKTEALNRDEARKDAAASRS